MERFCFTFEIREGTEDEYKKRHDEIWPELVAAIQDAGIANYSLFRRGTTIIGYCECTPDAATAFARVGASEPSPRWNEYFKDIIVSLTGPDGQLVDYPEVWHLD
jgi:L-rhamnose mutarotase